MAIDPDVAIELAELRQAITALLATLGTYAERLDNLEAAAQQDDGDQEGSTYA